MSHLGGNKKKRPRDNGAWGAYYANKNANKKDRYAEFDSSASRPINAGQQPTLARKRRQLAEDNHKWGNDPTSSKRAQDIFEDLIRSHREDNSFSGPSNRRIKYNPVLVNGRKRFWKRSLSNLSTRDCDVAWNEGRNNFLKFINNQGNEAIVSTATPNFTSNDSAGTDPKGNDDQSRTGTHKNKKAVDDQKPKAKKPSATNPQKPTPSDKPNPSSGTKEVGQTNLDVIDLCDSDLDNEISNQPSSEKNLKNSQSKKNVTATGIHNNKQLPTKKEADVSESIAPVTNSAPTTADTESKPVSNPIPKQSAVKNRWAYLFLGPNFRTNHVFSLDKKF